MADAALYDAAWLLAKDAGGSSARQMRQAMRSDLGAQFPHASFAELIHACTQARNLLAACYDVGEACRHGAISHQEAARKLSDEFPGFSPECYAEAVSYGMFISR